MNNLEKDVLEALNKLRQTAPLTHCMTNLVVNNFTANVLLAIGASPAMILANSEVADFVNISSSLLLNVGTITEVGADAYIKAAKTANEANTPWVLDPVAAGVLNYRTNLVKELIKYKPSIIRGNASEILALVGSESNGKGVDSTDSSKDAIELAKNYAKEIGTVIAISGEIDYITDGNEILRVPGGHEIMTKITGTGCSLGATMAAFLSVSKNPLMAAYVASTIFAKAGEQAAKDSKGPGSFQVEFIDNLYIIGK